MLGLVPEPTQTVLVSGGTGYLAGWSIIELLRRGYAVRTTVRGGAREGELRARLAPHIAPDAPLTVHTADLLVDAGWEDAVRGCDYVLHVASPFPPAQPRDADELIVPAREGTRRVLTAALDAGVRRVVVTSSVAAVGGSSDVSSKPLDEHDWTDLANPHLSPYVRSKTIAEQTAWELARLAGAGERLSCVNPGAILGPLISPDRSFSLEMIERLLKGLPGVPRIGFSIVDVRDVVDLHLAAMLSEQAGGERFVAVARFMWMADVAAALRERLGTDATRVPRRTLPDLLVRGMALFDPGVRSIVGQLGRRVSYTSQKAESLLGWSPRPVEDTIADCARSLLELRLA